MATCKRARAESKPKATFRYGLNTSTISGQKLSLVEEIGIAAKAGYEGIEPWIAEIDAYVKGGGSLKDLATMFSDNGLTVANGIGFFEWAVDDDAVRAKGLAEAQRNMEMMAQLGGKYIAAPAFGADKVVIATEKLIERYPVLMELGRKTGVTPLLEVWGFSKTLGCLDEALQVADACGRSQVCLLLDTYHLFKGGSGFAGIGKLKGATLPCFHMNDYPATPPRDTITDADRVYPGDGVAPLAQLFKDLRAIGFSGVLSLELFNAEYWKQDALTVAKTGLEKMKAAARCQ
ncbi:MAG: sugar phosphate isomerase/epimerase [Planctomycetota bacterium]|nr:sugar phosphate isomerase/epimerase [Planctomycetota bacterium]